MYTANIDERCKQDIIMAKGIKPNIDEWPEIQDNKDSCDE